MKIMSFLRPLFCLAVISSVCMGSASAEDVGGKNDVVIDHLTSFVYDGEDVRIHVRVTPKTDPGSVKFSMDIENRNGDTIGPVLPEMDGDSAKFVVLGPLLVNARFVVLKNSEGDKKTPVRRFTVLRAWEKFPALRMVRDGVETEGGSRTIILVKQVREESRRKWLLVKKVADWFKRRQPPEKIVLLCDLPSSWFDPASSDVIACAASGNAKSPCALVRLSGEFDLPKDTAVLVMLGNEDVHAGVDTVTFRRGVEAVVQQLRARGVERIRLATPVASSFHAPSLSRFEDVISAVSEANRLEGPMQSSRWLSGGEWRADGEGAALLRALPPESGRELVGRLMGAWR